MDAPRPDDPRRAALYMLVASTSFAAMAATVRVASAGSSLGATVFVRSLVIGVAVFLLLRARGIPVRWVNHRLMFVRDVAGFGAMLCYFWALANAPMADAVTLQYTSPLFVAMLAPLTVGERVTPWTGGWLGVGFLGVLLLVGPNGTPSLGALAALASAALAAVAYLSVRELRRTEHPEAIVLHFAIFGAVFASPAVPGLVADPPGGRELLALVCVGLFATVGQISMTRAYRFGEAAAVSGLSYITVALGIVVGGVWFGEPVSTLSLVGAGLIASSGIALARP